MATGAWLEQRPQERPTAQLAALDHTLLAVIQEAYVVVVGTRKVHALVAAVGASSVSNSEVNRIGGEFDKEKAPFRRRGNDDSACSYVWFDATYHEVREGGRLSARPP